MYWNLVDGYAWGKQGDMTSGENQYRGGLLHYDLTPKPSYNMINEMFNKKWRTNVKTETNSDGIAKLRGFYGDYDLTLTNENGEVKKEITLKKNAHNEFVFEI